MAALACSSFLAISKSAAPPSCSQTSPSSSLAASPSPSSPPPPSSSSVSPSPSPSLGLRASRSALFAGASLRMLRRGEQQQKSSGRPAVVSVRAAVDTAKLEKLGGEIKSLTLEEARNLVDWLQAELGVTAAAFAPAAAVPGAPGAAPGAEAAAPAAEEQTEFDVIIDEVPTAQRIAVIKAIRSVTTLGLKEAKDLIEGLPKPLKSAVPKEEAEEAKKQLEAAGAKCSLK